MESTIFILSSIASGVMLYQAYFSPALCGSSDLLGSDQTPASYHSPKLNVINNRAKEKGKE